MSQAAAGAGVLGLLGFAAVFLLALVFFVTESYFLAMALASLALLIYVAGSEIGKLLISSLTIFFSSKHLVRNATHLQETVVALRKFPHPRKDESGWGKLGPVAGIVGARPAVRRRSGDSAISARLAPAGRSGEGLPLGRWREKLPAHAGARRRTLVR
jgi:hypothetical protein